MCPETTEYLLNHTQLCPEREGGKIDILNWPGLYVTERDQILQNVA
jgi:hypothetical protein